MDGVIASPVSFPFARYRDGQREALDAVRGAFDRGSRVVALEAPTGAGKSAIAVALARDAGDAYLITHQKLLQDQYLRDFPDLASLKGRANYECLIADTHAAAAPCLVGRTLPACDDCPYFTAKDVALAAHATVMNYPYLLAEANHAGGFGTRELLVLDEAHGVEAALMRFTEVRLSDGDLARAGVEARLPQGNDPLGLLEGALDLVPALRARARALAAKLETLPPTSGRAIEALRRRRWLEGALRGLELVGESSDAGEIDWVVDDGRDADGRTLAFRPVDVAALAEPLLFRLGRRVLLMSATLLDAPTFLRSLGLDPDDVEVVRAPSTFPPERRPVRLRPVARLTRHRLAAELPRLVDAVADLMRDHPTEKGVIHAHSYRIAGAIEGGLPPELRARVRSHQNAGGRDAALAAHLDDPGPSVLLTPSMTEGIDLAGDAARWQAICKIPWPYLGDPQVAARRDRDPGWYAWRACLTVVQAYGRSVRSADDRAVTYLLDADFPSFLRRERARLPGWFVEAIDEAPAGQPDLG